MKASRCKWLILVACSLLCIALGTATGSADISVNDVLVTLGHKLFTRALPEGINPRIVSVVWSLRLPQVIMAFIVGAALAVSGTVMQSVLGNPLASSYTLGVSSGASLFAAIAIVTGFSLPGLPRLTLPIAGFVGGLITVALAIALTMRFDAAMENQTVILVGMVLSLFVNALLTLVTALSSDHLARLVFWQMGSFSGQKWINVGIQISFTIVCTLALCFLTSEMDLMTFGDEQAKAAGVNVKAAKIILIAITALLTGASVSMVGVIGFVDLIAPHVARSIFGSKHSCVVPASALLGGCLMVIAELLSRILLTGRVLPVGAVTALIGAPFFTYIFFSGRRRRL